MKESTPAADGMFAAVRGLNNSARDKIIRVWLLACSNEDAAAWRRLVEADKKRRQRTPIPMDENEPAGQTPASIEETIGTNSRQEDTAQRDNPPPLGSLSIPLPPTPPPASTPTHTHARPTVEQVASFLASTVNPVPIDKRAEMAQAYIDTRERTDPPWTLPATNDKPARALGPKWESDCRLFCQNWQTVLERQKALDGARLARFGGPVNSANGHDLAKLPPNPRSPQARQQQGRY